MDLEPSRPCALWLLPAEPWAEQLTRVIADLARRHSGPCFLPHVTLGSTNHPGHGPKPLIALQALASQWGPIALRVEGVIQGDDFFTCFALRLSQPRGLIQSDGALPETGLTEAAFSETALTDTGLSGADLNAIALYETAPNDTALPKTALPESALIPSTLIDAALKALPNAHGPAEGLHLSLLYAEPLPEAPLAAGEAESLIQALGRGALPLLSTAPAEPLILFDRLALVQPGPGGWRQGWPWTLVTSERLRGSPASERPSPSQR